MKLLEALTLAVDIKARESRRKTAMDYACFLNRFSIYWAALGNKDSLLEDFNKQQAMQYLDYVILVKKVSPVTRNNYLKAMRVFFFVLVDRQYIDKNPFSGIKKLKAPQKRRRVFSKAECSVICNFLKDSDNGLLLAISLCYYCALRPAELRRLKIEDISLKTGLVTLDGTMTKNKDLATITMPNHLITFLKEINISKYPANYYVFGSDLQPNPIQTGITSITRKHRDVLRKLAQYRLLTDIENKSFYSWKDTAARDMIEEGINAAALMKHFRHSSLETTQKYLESFGTKNDRIKELKSKLF